MPAPRKYPSELRERALCLVTEAMAEDPELSLNAAVRRIGPRVNVVPDTLRGWTKQARIDAGLSPGTTSGGAAKIKDLERKVKELDGERDLARGLVFLRAGARPAPALVVEFIDAHRERFGVEPICDVLDDTDVGIAPSTY